MVYADLTWNNDPAISEYVLEASLSGDHVPVFSYRRKAATALHCVCFDYFAAARAGRIRMQAPTVREFGTLFVKQFADVNRFLMFAIPVAFLPF
jgi:hypothetical protein